VRRIAAIAAVATVVLVAACGTDEKPTTASARSVGPSAGPDASRQVCSVVRRLSIDYLGKLTTIVGKEADAFAAGDTKAGEAAFADLAAQAREWLTKLREQRAGASDPRLRAAIDDLATAVERLASGDGTGSLNETNTAVQRSNTALVSFCG
jgi:hypothetical protein